MAKLKTTPIRQADLVEYLGHHSDFAFEISVLNKLLSRGFDCEHGGSYEDPFTKKPREFDLRARKTFGPRLIRLAVECKNLHDHFPALISCLPRRDEESFHEVACSVDPGKVSLRRTSGPHIPAFELRAKSVRLSKTESIYRPAESVGKSCDQVGRNPDSAIVANDSAVYSKWAQALSSAQELTDRACYDGEDGTDEMYVSVVVPVLVVPDGTLWAADYDANGARVASPRQVSRCPYFVQMSYVGGDRLHGMSYSISHLEFVTLAGLGGLIDELSGDDSKLNALFPIKRIVELLAESND